MCNNNCVIKIRRTDMKRFISYVIAALMIAALLGGCGSNMMNTPGSTDFPMSTADTVLPTPSTQVGSTGNTDSYTGSGTGTADMNTPGANVTTSPAPTASAK